MIRQQKVIRNLRKAFNMTETKTNRNGLIFKMYIVRNTQEQNLVSSKRVSQNRRLLKKEHFENEEKSLYKLKR